MARFQRLDGKDVFFLTGTDEHGQKMQQTARAEGISTEELAERNSNEFRSMGKMLNSSNDDFIRTTEPRHHEASQEIWKRMPPMATSTRTAMPAGTPCATRLTMPRTKPSCAPTAFATDRRHAGRMGGRGELFLQAFRL